MCQQPSLRAYEPVEFRVTSCPWDGRLSLQTDEAHIGQRHEDVEGNGNTTYYYYIRKEEGKWAPWRWNISTAFSSTSPDMLTSSIPINRSVYSFILGLVALNTIHFPRGSHMFTGVSLSLSVSWTLRSAGNPFSLAAKNTIRCRCHVNTVQIMDSVETKTILLLSFFVLPPLLSWHPY